MLKRINGYGFSLVELMIVVAIIGILSAVAIPNFKKYQAKSKTSEAKLQLASMYTALNAWFADYSNFCTCLDQMGYDVSTEYINRYYAVGFAVPDSAAAKAAVNNGAPSDCDNGTDQTNDTNAPMINTFAFGAGKQVSGFNMSGVSIKTGTITTSGGTGEAMLGASYDTFRVAALGHIDSKSIPGGSPDENLADTWTIDQNKNLKNHVIGY
jgi:type IV pilus assembly protein PilA